LALLALAGLPGLARAQADTPASGGALTVAAEPAQLVLGRDLGAELRVAAPPEVAELSITASVGKVDGVRRLPGGGFTARYHAPAERYPQVAIVAAVGRAGAACLDGWLAVPLAGQGDARVRGIPGADVSLRIGERSFGPGRVGGDGIAVLPVVVPPGVREGHQGFTAVDLHVPETTLVHAVLERSAAQADRSDGLRFLVYVIAPHGAARRGEAPIVEATRGSAVLRPREPGAFEGTWTLPPGLAGEERLTVRLEGSPASKVVLRAVTAPGPAAAVALAFDHPAIVAGSVEEVGVTARAFDAAGNPVASVVVFSADAGALTQEQAGPGAARATVRLGPRFRGRGQIVVQAKALTTGVTAEAPLPLQAAPPATARLRPARAYTDGDGRSDAQLTLEVRDAFGNLAAGTPRVTASAGAAPRLEPLERGRWAVRWRGEATDPPAPARLEATLGEARAEASVWAMPDARRQGALFLGAGGLVPLAGGGKAGGSLLLGVELPGPAVRVLSPERSLGLRVEVLAAARGRSVPGGSQQERSAAVLAGPVLKGLLPPARWFAGVTAGALWGTAVPPGRSARGGLAPALRLSLGVAAPVGRTAPFLELSLLSAGHTPAGGLTALLLSLGVRHDLVRPEAGALGD
jgi:hypothetical protein